MDLRSWLHPMGLALTLAALKILESIGPLVAGRGSVAHDARNIALGLTAALARAAIFPALLLWVSAETAAHAWGLLHRFDLGTAMSLGLGIFILDGWAYLWHILSHKTPLLWRFHAVHHHDAEVDASTSLRFHAGDVLASAAATVAAVPIFGLGLEHILLYELLVMPLSMFHHANIRLPEPIDRALRAVIVTPRMHLVHHSRWQVETDSNYSAIFSLWDRLFGTLRLRPDAERIAVGLDGYTEPDHATLRGCLLTPIGPIKSLPGQAPVQAAARTLGPCPTRTEPALL